MGRLHINLLRYCVVLPALLVWSMKPVWAASGPGIGTEFLLDDARIDRQLGVHRVLGVPVKQIQSLLPTELNPKLRAERILTVLFDDEESKFKMWYRAVSPKRTINATDSTVDASEQDPESWQAFLCYAESKDGINWLQPKLGRVTFNGDTRNNILLEYREVGDGVYFNIVKDRLERNPQRRYKATGYQNSTSSYLKNKPVGRAGIVVAYSADGLDWPEGAHLVMDSEDVTDADCVFPTRDPVTGKWIGFFRPRTGPKRRFIGYSESEDFDHWTFPRMLLTPDSRDSEWLEFYGLSAMLIDGWRIGSLWVFHNNPVYSPMTTELVFSRNGTEYHRVAPGKEFLALGQRGSGDSREVWPVSMIPHGGNILIYYNGANYEHGSDRGIPMQRELRVEPGAKPRSTFGVARLPWGHFAGLKADMDGMVETKWLTNYGSGGVGALLDTDGGGSVQCEILDQLGNVIPGWSRSESHLREEKDGQWSFYWNREDLVGQFGQVGQGGRRGVGHVVKLRFYLHKATLFGFRLGQSGSRPDYQ